MNHSTVAIFGGSFDPPTDSHVEIARRILSQGLADKVLVAPSFHHRQKANRASFTDRLAMCSLAFRDTGAIVSDVEASASQIEEGRGSSLNLVKEVLRLMPGHSALLVVGQDCVKDIPSWYHPQELLGTCRLLVSLRKGHEDVPLPDGSILLGGAPLTHSSTEVREGLLKRQAALPVHPAVLMYIQERRLYEASGKL
jgi:nicotinate-nucleotide adenylyltransferase